MAATMPGFDPRGAAVITTDCNSPAPGTPGTGAGTGAWPHGIMTLMDMNHLGCDLSGYLPSSAAVMRLAARRR